jgi:hypothetical protein
MSWFISPLPGNLVKITMEKMAVFAQTVIITSLMYGY